MSPYVSVEALQGRTGRMHSFVVNPAITPVRSRCDSMLPLINDNDLKNISGVDSNFSGDSLIKRRCYEYLATKFQVVQSGIAS